MRTVLLNKKIERCVLGSVFINNQTTGEIMDKQKFKKIALMGMAGGMLMANQTAANASIETQVGSSGTFLAAHGCAGGCAGRSANNSCAGRGKYNPPSYDDETAATDATDYQQDRFSQQQGMRPAGKTISENEFLSQLNSDGRSLYERLSPEGKAIALQLAQRFNDKNEAVRAAAQKINERRNQMQQQRVQPSGQRSY